MAKENISEISTLQLLPHRYPFLLIDRVLSITDCSLVAIKNVTINEPFFTGHFPSLPVMPGVLMLEALAQASGALIVKSHGRGPEEIFYLAGIDKVRFKRRVVPGDQMLISVELLKQSRGLWKFKGEITVDEQLVCAGEWMNMQSRIDDQ